MNHEHQQKDDTPGFWRSRFGIGYIAFGAIAAYFLLTEHLAHVIGALPYLVLLACPLMHVFMHHGHGHHRHDQHGETDLSSQDKDGKSS